MLSENKSFDRLILLSLLTVQTFLFYNFYRREIAWCPPQNFDQTVFLTEAYQLQERILSNGLVEIAKAALWSNGHPSGAALPIEGTLLSLIFGQGRFPLLLVNFVGFAILQVSIFYSTRSVWGNRAYGYIALGLILCQITPWFWAGGLFDFRMDFIAYCLFGLWVCAALQSDLFLNSRWAATSGFIGALLVLNRFLTIVYLLGIATGFALICVTVVLVRRADRDLVRRMRQRLTNLGVSIAVVALIAVPILFTNRRAINDYYVMRHLVNDQKTIRAQEAGITDLAGHLMYYPKSILSDHLGPMFLFATCIAVVAALFLGKRGRPESPETITRFPEGFFLQIAFLLGTILGPVAVLTADIAKSPVVGGIVGIPVVLLLVAIVTRIGPLAGKAKFSGAGNFGFVLPMLVLALGMYNQVNQASRQPVPDPQRSDLKKVAKLDKWLVEYATQHSWHSPKISVDVISGSFNAGEITVSGYEQTKELVEFQPMLGSDITGVEMTEALSLLAKSDFVILTTLPKTGVDPFLQEIGKYWNELKTWADVNMILARSVPFAGFTVSVYTRPTATISGLSGNWITSKGLSVEAERGTLRQFPVVQLSGRADFSPLPQVPKVSATIETEKGLLAVPASLQRTNGGYEIRINTSTVELPQSDVVRLRITFDTFFVPKKLGINEDTRELIVPAPSLVQLVRGEL